MAPSTVCSHCGFKNKTFLHCIRDCSFSKTIWHHLGFVSSEFFSITNTHDWLKEGSMGSRSFTFSVGVWCSRRHRNSMCFRNNIWPWHHLAGNLYNSVEVIKSSFSTSVIAAPTDCMVEWIINYHTCLILNVDGSYHGSPWSNSGSGEFWETLMAFSYLPFLVSSWVQMILFLLNFRLFTMGWS